MLIPFNKSENPIKCPCNGCVEPKRRFNCHAMCKEYKQYQADVKKYREKKQLEEERYIFSDTKRDWLQKKRRRNGR